MITVHVVNQISDYDAWKQAFDRYDGARRDHHVLAYRISQPADDDHAVYVDLDFQSRHDADEFVHLLERIWRTPLSRAVATGHPDPELRELREQRTVTT
ncbi:hypothetical protein [Kribbella sp. NPDC006257]|uniref:hypothetical protein n=1 Tax=Kribbella sp. NPDC006257 TaxID=3156738 RepID=UPI0033B00D37